MLDFYVLPMESMESLQVTAEPRDMWIDAEMAVGELCDSSTPL